MKKLFIYTVCMGYLTNLSAQETIYPAPAQKETIVLTNATIHVGNGQVINNGNVVITNGKITEVYADDYFNTKKTFKDMESSFTYVDTIDAGKDEINNYYDDYKSGKKVLDPQFINKKELDASYISGYKIKGYWYFDKRQGELKYRLLAICPVTPEARDAGNDNADVIDLFWVYFPSIRDILHESKAFNDKNSAMPITFDHLLNSRRFSGEIYKEENVYGDRAIEQYMKDNSQNQLMESERVKEKIRSFESDMWNY